MSHLCLWAVGTDLPVKILATIGGFTLGGFLGGWIAVLIAKFAFKQKVPDWLSWIVRLLSGLTVAYLTWMMLGGNFGFGLGSGGTGQGKDKSGGTDKADKAGKAGKGDKDDKTPVDPPKDKDRDPDDKGKSNGSGIGVGESIRVEILGDEPLKKLGGEKADLNRRYRVGDGGKDFRTFEAITKLILERRSQTPPLRKLDVVIYLDSPDPASPPVKRLVDWARDLDPGVAGALVVEEKIPPRAAPLK